MYKRLLTLPLERKNSFFLLGPRGTGKTLWLKANMPTSIYIDLLNSSNYQKFAARPDLLEKIIPPNWEDNWVIIDEIQKIPTLLNEVHRLIEEKKCLFAMTGSSLRKLRRGGVNLLAGRSIIYHMHPLLMQEVGDDFDLNKALVSGMLPSAVTRKNPIPYLDSYIEAYIREEVSQEGFARKLSSFSRFLEIASLSQGQILNKANVARESHVKERTVRDYFDLLEDLLIAKLLPAFSKKVKRAVVRQPKFYFFDTGVYMNIRPKGPLDNPQSIGGIALETLFFQSLRAINDTLGYRYQLFYWRTTHGLEVDFVAYGERGLVAIEVKSSENLTRHHLKALKAFKEEFPMAKTYIVYGGKSKMYFNDIVALPIQEALKKLPSILEKGS